MFCWLLTIYMTCTIGYFGDCQSCGLIQIGNVPYRVQEKRVTLKEILNQKQYILTINNESQQIQLQSFMSRCQLSNVWLGFQQIQPQPWGWTRDCCNYQCPSAEQLIVAYQGCYREETTNNSERDLPINSYLPSEKLSVDTCINMCKTIGAKYAGLHYETVSYKPACFCGNSFGRYGPGSTCNLTCPKRNHNVQNGQLHPNYCGSTNQNAVYRIDGHWVKWANYSPGKLEQQSHNYCGALTQKKGFSLTYEVSCQTQLNYICKVSVKGVCRMKNWTTIEVSAELSEKGICYFLSNGKSDWYTAKQTCSKRLNGSLLRIRNEMEHKSLARWLKRHIITINNNNDIASWLKKNTITSSDNADYIWVGLYRNSFAEISGAKKAACYTNFATAQPNLTPVEDTSVFVYVKATENYQWFTSSEIENNYTVISTTKELIDLVYPLPTPLAQSNEQNDNSSTSGSDDTSINKLAIIIPVAAAVIIIFLLCAFCFYRELLNPKSQAGKKSKSKQQQSHKNLQQPALTKERASSLQTSLTTMNTKIETPKKPVKRRNSNSSQKSVTSLSNPKLSSKDRLQKYWGGMKENEYFDPAKHTSPAHKKMRDMIFTKYPHDDKQNFDDDHTMDTRDEHLSYENARQTFEDQSQRYDRQPQRYDRQPQRYEYQPQRYEQLQTGFADPHPLMYNYQPPVHESHASFFEGASQSFDNQYRDDGYAEDENYEPYVYSENVDDYQM